jgi:hypothetical protein
MSFNDILDSTILALSTNLRMHVERAKVPIILNNYTYQPMSTNYDVTKYLPFFLSFYGQHLSTQTF